MILLENLPPGDIFSSQTKINLAHPTIGGPPSRYGRAREEGHFHKDARERKDTSIQNVLPLMVAIRMCARERHSRDRNPG